MAGSPTFQRLSRETLDEHKQIHFFIDQLRSALDDLDPDSSDVEPLRRLAAQIESCREHLQEHFEREERGGVYQAILEIVPDAGAAIHGFTQQHHRMIEILQMARIHAERGEAVEAGPLKTDLQNFLDMMRQHELAEEALLARAIEEESRSIT
jgi:hypothetical protein